ncbi:PEP-CTERM sorting domain-containing protein [Nitrosomonas sp. Is79A3]|uniref:PEP-CTERM sorting domain-containing protein n=1 Tax=Nitrosomonas sp. (strain Is79A3) TaxID=261292 RepID=UPI00031F77F4
MNSPVNISSAAFYFDDADGAGGVSAPASVTVDGINFLIADPSGPSPFSFVANGLSFAGNDLVVTIERNNTWVFLSEVEFNAAPIPEPETETYAMLLAGLGLLGFVARRKQQNV